MANLGTSEKQILEKVFQMSSGYVLNFSDRTMKEFFRDDIGIDIFDSKYDYESGSKANRLRCFWLKESNELVGKTINLLLDYVDGQILIDNLNQKDFPPALIEAGRKIAEQLIGPNSVKDIQERVVKELKDEKLWVRTSLEGKDLHINIGDRSDGKGEHVHLISDSSTGEMRVHGVDKAPGDLLSRVVSLTTKEGKTINVSQQVKTTLEFSDINMPDDNFKSWVDVKSKIGLKGLNELGINAFMEVKFELIPSKNELSLSKIREAARNSTIPYFGWPIAVFIDEKEEFAPKPDSDGIFAELSIPKNPDEKATYDFWAINKSGHFYLIKSLFEDARRPEYIFFDTRIIRIAETLMYARNLYHKLGFPNDQKVKITIKHSGFKGRKLGAANPGRDLFRYVSSVDNVESEGVFSISQLDNEVPEIVEKFTKPLFEKFGFFELDYSDIRANS